LRLRRGPGSTTADLQSAATPTDPLAELSGPAVHMPPSRLGGLRGSRSLGGRRFGPAFRRRRGLRGRLTVGSRCHLGRGRLIESVNRHDSFFLPGTLEGAT
jgi:hypothetical protein